MDADNGAEKKGPPQVPPADESAASLSEPPPAVLGPQPFTDYLVHQLKTMEDRVKTLESQKAASTTKGNAEASSRTKAKLTPTVRWCNWEQFKNTFSEDEGNHSIDVLQAGQQIKDDVRQEVARRIQAEDGTYSSATTLPSFSSNGTSSKWIRQLRIKSKIVLSLIERISGRYGLYHLSSDRPAIFLEPFKSLIFVHEELKRESATLPRKTEETFGRESGDQGLNSGEERPNPAIDAIPSVAQEEVENPSSARAQSDQSDATTRATMVGHLRRGDSLFTTPLDTDELAELNCYLNFMDEHIMPRYTQLRTGTAEMDFCKKVRARDLWMLFQPGELLYVPPPSQVGKPKASTEQRVWRLWAFEDSDPEWNFDSIEKEHYSSLGRKKDKKESDDAGEDDDSDPDKDNQVRCYYLDYTGTTFCPVEQTFLIDAFEGEVEITALKAYPLRFLPDREAIVKKLREERANFVSYTKGNDEGARGKRENTKNKQQALYDGWSIVENVLGQEIAGTSQSQQYIDSEVIVDFEEAYQSFPSWKPHFFWSLSRDTPYTEWKTDNLPVVHWKDSQRSGRLSEEKDLFQVRANFHVVEANQWAEKDRFVTLASYTATNEPPRCSPEGDEILLLPTRVFAYSLRDRKFFQIDIRHLRAIDQDHDPFGSLQIHEQHKRTIESLLHTHFENKRLENFSGPEIPNQDLIRGKGRGIVVLLHGAPGVGKTATVEAVAQKYKRPLFSISCGDLGYQPEKVETALTEIFRLAQVWNCVLLLDEADVFLTQRTINELKRNAMVSTILRILEYYKGVLFLTTNRPGALDEALKSRVHVSLHYPPLDGQKMQEIFNINLKRLDEIEQRRSQSTNSPPMFIFRDDILSYAKVHFERYGSAGLGSWNGRQIRNAFQVASAMARYEGEKTKAQVQLRASHFQEVAEATRQYDEFRRSTLKSTDSEIAKRESHRDDAYVFSPEGTPGDRGGYSRQYGGATPGYSNNSRGQRPNMTDNSPSYTTHVPPQTAGYQSHNQQWPRFTAATGSPAPRPAQLHGGYSGPAMNSMPSTHAPQSTPDKDQANFHSSLPPRSWAEHYHDGETSARQADQGQMGHSGESDYYAGRGPMH